jgi:hypothetical protein
MPELQKLGASIGYDVHIHDGKLEMIKRKGYVSELVPYLTAKTGLIGSPEPGKDGVLKFKSLLQPKIKIFRRVKIEAESVKGTYIIKKITHTGDTHGQEWYTECEGEKA